jgi:hypothetical protein
MDNSSSMTGSRGEKTDLEEKFRIIQQGKGDPISPGPMIRTCDL